MSVSYSVASHAVTNYVGPNNATVTRWFVVKEDTEVALRSIVAEALTQASATAIISALNA